ncbi:Hypothetical predicted protein [Cloeon dipterum]|uniref:Uncharacterized protein n=1 Tax=Cloeon dipterum TaxID=197152 RepID=A0A8S1CHI2_9INSE|nr:Hypothetical predicted protein [Cloeon dipterum]
MSSAAFIAMIRDTRLDWLGFFTLTQIIHHVNLTKFVHAVINDIIFNQTAELHRLSSPSTWIHEPPQFDMTYWEDRAQYSMDDLPSFPPFLDGSWNNLRQIYSRPGHYTKILSSPSWFKELHLSVMTKNDAQIMLTNSGHDMLEITFDSNDNHGYLTVQFCQGVSGDKPVCELLQSAKTFNEDGYLKKGKEWVHFRIKLEMINSQTMKSIEIADAKNGEVLLNSTRMVKFHESHEITLLVRSATSTGSWRFHEDSREPVLLHGGSGGESIVMLNLTSSSSTDSHCLQISYYLREGFGSAFVRTSHATYPLMADDGKWIQRNINFYSFKPSMEKLIFGLPDVNVSQHGHVFAMHRKFTNCTLYDVMYLELKLKDEQPIDSTIGCQTISYKSTERFASLKSTASLEAYSECGDSSTLFGRSCRISCTPFAGGPMCDELIMCDRDTCKCLPGKHNKDTACEPDTRDKKINEAPLEEHKIGNEEFLKDYNTIKELRNKLDEDGGGHGSYWIFIILCVISWALNFVLLALIFLKSQANQYVPLRTTDLNEADDISFAE